MPEFLSKISPGNLKIFRSNIISYYKRKMFTEKKEKNVEKKYICRV